MQRKLHNSEKEAKAQKAKISTIAGKSFFTPPVF